MRNGEKSVRCIKAGGSDGRDGKGEGREKGGREKGGRKVHGHVAGRAPSISDLPCALCGWG